MYRKRKSVSPYFRLPAPYDPVTGGDHRLSPSKPYCRFALEADLATTDDRQDAMITHQYGPGLMHSQDSEIIVFNLETEETGVYTYSGEQGEAGFAVWDQGRLWRIVGMEGARTMYIGKTSEIIASESTGTVVRHDETWQASTDTFTVLNPHDIDLPADLKVRWTKYPGWSNWVVEPWHWTECPPEE